MEPTKLYDNAVKCPSAAVKPAFGFAVISYPSDLSIFTSHFSAAYPPPHALPKQQLRVETRFEEHYNAVTPLQPKGHPGRELCNV